MAIPTVTVTVTAFDGGGAALTGATVSAEQKGADLYGNQYVWPTTVTATIGADGTATLDVFPSLEGTMGSFWQFTITDTDGYVHYETTARVPNSDCTLSSIADNTRNYEDLPSDWEVTVESLTADIAAVSTDAIDALAVLTPAADKLAYFTGATTAALATLTSYGRSLIATASAAAAATLLGLGTASAVTFADLTVTNLTGYVKANGASMATASSTIPNTDITGLGTMSTQNASAVAITGGAIAGITDLAVADGGTGASTAADARTNLGLGTAATYSVGTFAQVANNLSDLTNAGTARTNLGLGTIATQAASSVSISGGAITGTTISGSTGSFTTLAISSTFTQNVDGGGDSFHVLHRTATSDYAVHRYYTGGVEKWRAGMLAVTDDNYHIADATNSDKVVVSSTGLSVTGTITSTTGSGANYLIVASGGLNTADRGIRFNDSAGTGTGWIAHVPNSGTDAFTNYYVGGSSASNIVMKMAASGSVSFTKAADHYLYTGAVFYWTSDGTSTGTKYAGIQGNSADGLNFYNGSTPTKIGAWSTSSAYGSTLNLYDAGFGAWVQGSSAGSTHAFIGNFKYNFTDPTASVSPYTNAGYGIQMSGGIKFFAANAGVSGTFTPTEAARFNSTGSFLVGTTGALASSASLIRGYSSGNAVLDLKTDTATSNVVLCWNAAASGDNKFVSFLVDVAGTSGGTIDYNRAGGAVRYNTTSDGTLKHILGDADPAGSVTLLRASAMRRWYWLNDPNQWEQMGPIAQELYEVFPGAVSEGGVQTDGTYRPWAVDKTAFSFHLVLGWQYHDGLLIDHDNRIAQCEAWTAIIDPWKLNVDEILASYQAWQEAANDRFGALEDRVTALEAA